MQQVVEVVGDAAGHHAEALEPLGLAEAALDGPALLVGPAALGDVADRREQPARPALPEDPRRDQDVARTPVLADDPPLLVDEVLAAPRLRHRRDRPLAHAAVREQPREQAGPLGVGLRVAGDRLHLRVEHRAAAALVADREALADRRDHRVHQLRVGLRALEAGHVAGEADDAHAAVRVVDAAGPVVQPPDLAVGPAHAIHGLGLAGRGRLLERPGEPPAVVRVDRRAPGPGVDRPRRAGARRVQIQRPVEQRRVRPQGVVPGRDGADGLRGVVAEPI